MERTFEPNSQAEDKSIDYRELKKEIENSNSQAIMLKLANAYVDPAGTGFLIQYEVVNMLMARIGTESLKAHWKEKYEENMEKLLKLGVLVSSMNFYLFHLNTLNVIKESNVNSPSFLKYREMFARCSIYFYLLYEAFYILLEATDRLKYLSIDNSYISEARKRYENIK